MAYLKSSLCPLLTANVCDSLKNVGVRNVTDFVGANLEDLAIKSSISYTDLVAIRRVILIQFSSFPINGKDLYDHVVSSTAILSTGCQSIDDLLDSGLYTAEVTEVIGGAATGKSQLCMSASLWVAMEIEQNVIFLDTGGSFDINRIRDMFESRAVADKTLQEVCQRILCCPVYDVFELITQLENIKSLLSKQTESFYSYVKLIIVDSVASVIAPVLGSSQNDGHGLMMYVAHLLHYLAVEYAVAILICNNVVVINGDHRKAGLGRAWQAVPTVRLELSCDVVIKANGQVSSSPERRVVLCKSPRQAAGQSCTFSITNQGLACTAPGTN